MVMMCAYWPLRGEEFSGAGGGLELEELEESYGSGNFNLEERRDLGLLGEDETSPPSSSAGLRLGPWAAAGPLACAGHDLGLPGG